MITRTHTKGDAPSTAVYSDCERYRYSLTRVWDHQADKVLFVMLNPSTATEVQNDPTVERCERRARTLGFGGFRVTNIFAWRDTDPRNMKAAADPIGPHNDATLAELARVQPVTSSQMLNVSGIGDTKLARYGEPFLSLIKQHLN